MGYQTQREKIKQFMEKKILPVIKKQDVDYYKLVSATRKELNTSESMIEDEIKNRIENKEIKEIRVLTINDEEIVPFFKRIVSEEKTAEKTLEELKEGVKEK